MRREKSLEERSSKAMDVRTNDVALFALLLCSSMLEISGDCLYPQWKVNCQQTCMTRQLTDIQLNQCYSMDINLLKCQCNGQDLAPIIKAMFVTTIPPTSTSRPLNHLCVPDEMCESARVTCQGNTSVCRCLNAVWTNQSCPERHFCKEESSTASCQLVASIVEQTSSASIQCTRSLALFTFSSIVVRLTTINFSLRSLI